jgi:hypothetical protein
VKIKYKNPVYKGKKQFVPVVMKDRDCLICFISQMHSVVENIGELLEEMPGVKKKTAKEIIEHITSSCLNLDNTRFNGYAKDGLNLNTIDQNELKDILVNFSESQEIAKLTGENGENILGESYFYINCCCGNYVSFKGPENIPEKNLNCDLCERLLIDYTGKHDFEFEYDEED